MAASTTSGPNENPLEKQIDAIQNEIKSLEEKLRRVPEKSRCLAEIETWQESLTAKIKKLADDARQDVTVAFEESSRSLVDTIQNVSNQITENREKPLYFDTIITECRNQIKICEEKMSQLPSIRIILPKETTIEKPSVQSGNSERNRNVSEPMDISLNDPSSNLYPNLIHSTLSSSHYPCMTFGVQLETAKDIHTLFDHLMTLNPMDKHAMSGRCIRETDQMVQFLQDIFGFRNLPNKWIVHGVQDFAVKKRPHELPPAQEIHFPSKQAPNVFSMSVREILQWQSSFHVYAQRNVPGMSKDFIQKALQGHSEDGEEAFRMKFVVRVSTCPILMEFDGQVIERKSDDRWPHRIKLVSVTGIDFAARRHDVFDIYNYIANWENVFQSDPKSKSILLSNERDLALQRNPAPVQLRENQLMSDLRTMAKLRLRACEREGVQIVVETGIGLGVFSGRQLGIERAIQTASALAIRAILEEEGSSYKNIRAVIFALPIFHKQKQNEAMRSCFSVFTEQFQEPNYKGPIPVMIADQDMHRLTVAIAKKGFSVSELNPADSHGVFGEYWQNYGPAVEEKLALTTLGLLIQHHRFNEEVLNTARYYLID